MEHTPQTNTMLYASKTEERIVFFFVTVGIISLTYGVLFLFDFLPEKPGTTVIEVEEALEVEENDVATTTDILPVSIIFDTLGGKEVKILNPEIATVEALDTALLSGVVRHPDSADFINPGTIFLLGHSSYLPVVNNKNYQAFNGIQKLEWGDTIRLQSNTTEYIYSVDRVYEAKAIDDEIEIKTGEARLVLATCNSFATKDDRFIVEAVLIKSNPITGKASK